MRDIIAAVAVCCVILTIAFILTGVVAGIGLIFDKAQCSRWGQLYNLETTWGPLTGCNARFENKWVPMSRYRAVEEIKR